MSTDAALAGVCLFSQVRLGAGALSAPGAAGADVVVGVEALSILRADDLTIEGRFDFSAADGARDESHEQA